MDWKLVVVSPRSCARRLNGGGLEPEAWRQVVTMVDLIPVITEADDVCVSSSLLAEDRFRPLPFVDFHILLINVILPQHHILYYYLGCLAAAFNPCFIQWR
jgi:hypothetical protein